MSTWHDELGPCGHPQCLAAASVQLEAQWSPQDWRDLDVCLRHAPWGVQQLLKPVRSSKAPIAIVSRQLHPPLHSGGSLRE